MWSQLALITFVIATFHLLFVTYNINVKNLLSFFRISPLNVFLDVIRFHWVFQHVVTVTFGNYSCAVAFAYLLLLFKKKSGWWDKTDKKTVENQYLHLANLASHIGQMVFVVWEFDICDICQEQAKQSEHHQRQRWKIQRNRMKDCKYQLNRRSILKRK